MDALPPHPRVLWNILPSLYLLLSGARLTWWWNQIALTTVQKVCVHITFIFEAHVPQEWGMATKLGLCWPSQPCLSPLQMRRQCERSTWCFRGRREERVDNFSPRHMELYVVLHSYVTHIFKMILLFFLFSTVNCKLNNIKNHEL